MVEQTIEMKVPAMAKDRLNEILCEMPEHKKYVLSTLSEYNSILKQLDVIQNKKTLIKTIHFFTVDRENSIKESLRPEPVKTHLLNLIQTIGKIKMRNLKPIWHIVDENLVRVCNKTFWAKSAAENRLKRLKKRDDKKIWVISGNEFQEMLYLNKREYDY